jgi:hypothetical protein
MANSKISELTTLSASNVTPSEDYLHIIDDSAAVSGKNKRVTIQALLSGAGGTASLPYKYNETFKAHNNDVHTSEHKNSLTTPHIWQAPPTGNFPNTARIRCWGAGAGGGGGNNLANSGGGGGAGCFSETMVTYIPGEQFQITVGIGGHGGNGSMANENGVTGQDGSMSKVTSADGFIVYCRAPGGSGGVGAIKSIDGGTGGNGGSNLTAIGDSSASGSAGSKKGFEVGRVAGNGGSSYTGGRGGTGSTTSDAGNARSGLFPGGGGGGGCPNGGINSALSNAGAGAYGLITIEYNNDPVIYSSTVHSV